jgi:3-hydroxyisobutyrate dehydrogenase
MHAGFIGLGSLGTAMATRLRGAGVTLTVWNRTRAKAEAFGAAVAASPADLIGRVPAVFLSLSTSDAVEAVLRGHDGLLGGDCAGKLVIDTTTNHHAPVPLFHELCAQRGARYVESPVAGSVVPALEGRLMAMVSGRPEDITAARPYLDLIATKVHVLGAPGQATRMKLVNNLCLGTFLAALGEALATAEAAGIDRTQALDVLGDGAGKGAVLASRGERMLAGDWSSHFSCAMMVKDLHCLQDLARDLGIPQHLAGVVKEQFARTFRAGLGDADVAAIHEIFRRG